MTMHAYKRERNNIRAFMWLCLFVCLLIVYLNVILRYDAVHVAQHTIGSALAVCEDGKCYSACCLHR